MTRDQTTTTTTTTTPTNPDAARSWLSGGGGSSSPPSQDLQQPPQSNTTTTPQVVPGQQQPQQQQKPKPTTHSSNRISLSEVASTISPSDFLSVHETPCARQGFMTGIGAGAGIGVLRWIMGLPIPKAANWGVGCGIVGAMAQYEYCQWQRRKEKEKMQRVVAVYTKKQAENRAKEAKEAKEKAEKGEVQVQGMSMTAPGGGEKKSWYKFW
ncbi:cytochrome oxidase biogenesis protein, Cox20 subunit [Neurospora intermedia]|uniref:Cytochrome c oxidase assembly protein COX20, mitochondrial n=1 Tax=Neurospora intermedia TaxID=5142 RepID=A0ABR3D6P0_NEUIN